MPTPSSSTEKRTTWRLSTIKHTKTQTLWFNNRYNELLDEIKELKPDYRSKTAVVETALEHYADELRTDDAE